MKPIFSILIPTRERVPQLEIFLGTLTDNTKHHENIEVLIAYDDDDIITESYLQRCKKRFGFNIRLYKTEQSDFINANYYNELAARANGEFRWLCGDDLIIVKKDWDVYLIEKINEFLAEYKGRAIYVRIKDDTPKPEPGVPDYANFPMISKDAIKAVGYFMPPEVPSWSADYMIYLVYSHILSNRVLNIDEDIVNHISYLRGDREETASTGRMRAAHGKYKISDYIPYWEERILPELRGKLKQYIDTYKGSRNEPIKLF